jgi:hypothetical protein
MHYINPLSDSYETEPEPERMDVHKEYERFMRGWEEVTSRTPSLDDNPITYINDFFEQFKSKAPIPLQMTIPEMALLFEIINKYRSLLHDVYKADHACEKSNSPKKLKREKS